MSDLRPWCRDMEARMLDAGIESAGQLSYRDVAELYSRAKIYLYPTCSTEVDCLSVSKALIGGAIPIVSRYAALAEKELFGGIYIPLQSDDLAVTALDCAVVSPVTLDRFIEACYSVMSSGAPEIQTAASEGEHLRGYYDWRNVEVRRVRKS
jgi:glycosyltransferase involved in cell wall biosynthesis